MQPRKRKRNYRVYWDMPDECEIDVRGEPFVYHVMITQVWLNRFVYFVEKTTFDAAGNVTERTVAQDFEPSLPKARLAAMNAFRRHHNAIIELAA